MRRLGRAAAIAMLAILCGCASNPTPDVNTSLSIMAFNVENLFDANDDPGKDDHDYLPLAEKQTEAHRAHCLSLRFESWQQRCLNVDWSESVVTQKLGAIAAAIQQVDGGLGPDIVVLQEVENIAILERLRRDFLASSNYQPAVLVEGNDSRGIDVAFLSRLPLAGEAQLHDIRFSDEFADRAGDTRGILQADFRMADGSLITGFAVHFPAPYHPTEMRVAAYDTLNRLLAALPADRAAFAGGDFNTTSAEDSEKNMLDRFARPYWLVSNDLCPGCRGTSYFAPDDSWSFLDMVLWRPCCGENTTDAVRKVSAQIANETAAQRRDDGTPRRFDGESGTGVSDHWPVLIRVESE